MAISNKELVETFQKAIEQTKRHPFLFLGSGFSMRYLGTPTFEGLLKYFTDLISGGNEYKFASYGTAESTLPQIAQELEKDFKTHFLNNDDFMPMLKKQNSALIKNRVSPLKIALADYFQNFTIEKIKNSDPQISKEIKLLKKISTRGVSGIITTNYDNLAESIFDGFQKYIGQDELFFAGIQEISEIYKIHGCCTNPESILITQQDYDKFHEKDKYLAAKLMTIFLEYPIVFIGYSINDENIKRIIKNITECLTPEQLKKLSGRLFFVKRLHKGDTQSISTHTLNELAMTQISTNDFSLIYEAIGNVRSQYNPRIIRRLKKDVYDVVMSNNPSRLIKVVGLADIDDNQEIDSVVIGVGKDYYGKEPTAADIYRNILFEDARLDAKKVLEDYLPKLITQSTKMPIFKYIKQMKDRGEKVVLCDKVSDLANDFKQRGATALYSNTDKKKINKYGATYMEKTINDLVDTENNNDPLPSHKAYTFVYLLQVENINLDDFYRLLCKTLEGESSIINDSFFKKMIRLYDYLKYADKS